MRDPVCMMETLIPVNFKACHTWNENSENIKVRPYQYPMLNYSYLFAKDKRKSKTLLYRIKKYAGELINLAARGIGKSFCAICDAFFTLIHTEGSESCVSSFDGKHLRKISWPIKNFAEHHPLFQIFRRKGKSVRFAHGELEIETLKGHNMYGKNEDIGNPDPGDAFHSLHCCWWLYDEAQRMSEKGTEKRVDAIDMERGCINRLSGIPDVRIGSPLGQIFNDEDNKTFICRIPQFIMPGWTEEYAKDQAKKYKGRDSIAWKLNVEAEIIEGAFGFWDIERIKENCLRKNKEIKHMEVNKETFHMFKQKIILERLPCEQVFVCLDMGEGSAPSEIIILFYDGKKYKYHYNISLHKLTTFEQEEILWYIYNKLKECFIATDATSVSGRDIIDNLVRRGVPKENTLKVNFNENIDVDFIYENDGKTVKIDVKSGQPLMRRERADQFAMPELERLFYSSLIEIPNQYKFFYQFGNIVAKRMINYVKYGSSIAEDHLHAAFMVFAVCRHFNQFKLQNKQEETTDFIGGF